MIVRESEAENERSQNKYFFQFFMVPSLLEAHNANSAVPEFSRPFAATSIRTFKDLRYTLF
jgi:hypothetical protein